MIIVAILFLILYSLFCIRSPKCGIICSLFLFLPIQGTIKYVFFSSGATIFALWKEVGILVLFLKAFKKNDSRTREIFCVFSILFFYSLFFLVLGKVEGLDVNERVKTIFFPCLLTIAVAKSNFTQKDIKQMILCVLVGSLIINISGLIDFFSNPLRMMFRQLVGATYKEAADGTIYYDRSSYAIMGLNRVCGLMYGGPNQMGVYNSVVSTICVMALLFFKSLLKSDLLKKFFFVCFFLSIFCLLTSFSRAGWLMFLITFLYVGLSKANYRPLIIKLALIGVVVFFVVFLAVPEVRTVVEGSLSGKEASSAARASMTISALDFLYNHPLGLGFGASAHGAAFAESSLINIGVDIGVAGLLILVFLLFVIYRRNKKMIRRNAFASACAGFTLAYTIVSFVSVNPFETPCIYFSWFLMGFGLATVDLQQPKNFVI